MSGAIRDIEKLNQRQIESAKRRNERELRTLETAHQKYKSEVKKANDSDIIEIQDQHHRQLNVEAEKKEKVLAEMRDHLQKSTEMTDKELKSLKQNAEKERVDTQKKLSVDRDRISGEHELYLDDLNERYNASSRKVNFEGKQRIESMEQEMAQNYSDKEAYNSRKLNEQRGQNAALLKQDSDQYKKIKDDQDKQFKNERVNTNNRQQIEMGKLTETHVHELEKRDDNYRKGLKEQDKFFEEKFKDTLTRHNGHFKELDEQHAKVIESMKSNLTKEISQAASRNDDPFYKFDALKPKMTKFEDRIEIQVQIPEHSKQDVNLTTNNKEAVISFNRRYVDANRTPEGIINKLNKVESFTTRMNTDMVLDPKSVKSSYENGTMTYVIKKA